MPVRQLSETIVNRIAAGEVVERPASVVKELIENALDAGAARIDVLTDGGGRRLIQVTDDGAGMTAADLALEVERHATSKLPDDDLLHIRTLGFRGEALPSIGAVARLAITSRHAAEPQHPGQPEPNPARAQRRCQQPCGGRSETAVAQHNRLDAEYSLDADGHRPVTDRSAATICVGVGGQPGISTSTGTTSPTAPTTP